MKKFLLSFFVVFTFVFYAVYNRLNPNFLSEVFFELDDDDYEYRRIGSMVLSTTTSPMSSDAMPMAGKYKDGEFVGMMADAFYGNVQVKVVINNGRLTDVIFLEHPQHSDTSRYLNAQAMPLLKEEAIQAQSAQVNTISGASATSDAFRQSLNAALVLALK